MWADRTVLAAVIMPHALLLWTVMIAGILYLVRVSNSMTEYAIPASPVNPNTGDP